MELRLHTILLTALAATLAACGQPPETGTRVSFMDVAQSAAREEDRVSVEQLAEWLIEERKDFVLIDVRSQDEFTKGRIHEARNVPLAELVASETIATLPSESNAEATYGSPSVLSQSSAVLRSSRQLTP